MTRQTDSRSHGFLARSLLREVARTGACWPALLWLVGVLAAGGQTLPATDIAPTEIRGRVVCLAEEMQRRHKVELQSGHDHIWGFRTEDGACFTLLRTRYSEAIFLDPELRKKELLLKARRFPGTQILEVTYLHTVRDGVVQDFYYYCDICSIKSISPEICSCCREPVRPVETPLNGGTD